MKTSREEPGAELVDNALCETDSGFPAVGVRWYADGSIRIRIEGMGPVYVDELYIHQSDPMIRVKPNKGGE